MMSRTKTGSKGSGYDFWGKRIESANCGHGKYVKTQTHRRERKRDKRRLAEGHEMETREAF
jgi:hypothetical protein